MAKLRVFVYGTLKSGRPNNGALESGKFLGRTTIKGTYHFASLGWYPGVVQLAPDKPEREIGGEVWEIDSDTLSLLDMIEGHPNYYRRVKVPTEHGRAWCYMLPEAYADSTGVPDLFWHMTDEEAQWANERTSQTA